jgi:CBS domain-containing protein
MNASDVMKRDVHTCSIDDSLESVARVMWEHCCGCVPLVDADGKAVAMITDRDIAMAAYLQGKPLHEIPARSAASRVLTTVYESTPLEVIETRMADWQVRRIPVVDSADRIVGLVALSDIVTHGQPGGRRVSGVSAETVAKTLRAICEDRCPATPLAPEG